MNTPSSGDTLEVPVPKHDTSVDLPCPSARVRVDVAGLSDVGKVRQNNEDHFLVTRFGRFLESLDSNLPTGEVPPRSEHAGYAMMVADGIGGSAAGEVASRLAIRTLIDVVLKVPDWILRLDDPFFPQEVMRRATERYDEVNAALAKQAQRDPNLRGFGTTMTVAWSLGWDLFVAHIGDSRTYLFRHDTLHQLTKDHTMAQVMADTGLIAQREVAAHRLRHVLVKAMGDKGQGVEPDVHHFVLEAGDGLLLCTDGLTDMVNDRRIAELLQSTDNAHKACQALVEEALRAGGKDNVTVVVAHYALPR